MQERSYINAHIHTCMYGPGKAHVQGWPEPFVYSVFTAFLAGMSLNIRSYTVYIYGCGQPYTYTIPRVGQNHINIYGVYTVFLAEKSPNIRSYTVYIYGSGQTCSRIITSTHAGHGWRPPPLTTCPAQLSLPWTGPRQGEMCWCVHECVSV